ncbi:hypothetical protein [Actinosynnema pretiosum]|uniref:Uncharacterized protein n=1 Tax=Actinosynnema pretiosum TaxID=42197 RepID=A0A290Z6U2_9PSEU|nr:hypothetical protein [Actinosynnema pretiosum]ATE54716.1 hypothetical protein CNX65_16705 [Actinosynnema pretiosum]
MTTRGAPCSTGAPQIRGARRQHVPGPDRNGEPGAVGGTASVNRASPLEATRSNRALPTSTLSAPKSTRRAPARAKTGQGPPRPPDREEPPAVFPPGTHRTARSATLAITPSHRPVPPPPS